MLLFICHATEDKPDFVRPLAEALRKDYEVWYDEYQLTLGDSLLQKINEGLAACDFGIVVFSPAFFALSKKWTRAELGGLFALEGASRKIILPIRKDLTPEELATLLPTMGDRLSVSTSAGLPKVIEEIKLAVEVSERKRQLTVRQSAAQRARSLDQMLKEKHDGNLLLNSVEGATIISEGIESFLEALKSEIEKLSAESQIVKFECARPMRNTFYASTAYRITLGIYIGFYNELSARIFVPGRPHFSDKLEEVKEIKFKPEFRTPKRLVWVAEPEKQVYGMDELIGLLIDEMIAEVDRRSKRTDVNS